MAAVKVVKQHIEAARATALAAHAAAGLVATSSKEATRLLRSAEALARAAVAVLTASRTSSTTSCGTSTSGAQVTPPVGAGLGTAEDLTGVRRRRRGRRNKQKNEKNDAKGVVTKGADVHVSAEPVVLGGRALRRHNSVYGPSATSSSSAAKASSMATLCGLVARPELNGMYVKILRRDMSAGRAVVQLPNGDEVRIKPENFSEDMEVEPRFGGATP